MANGDWGANIRRRSSGTREGSIGLEEKWLFIYAWQGTEPEKHPFIACCLADQRSGRNGRFIEHIGIFDPRVRESPFSLDRERFDYWTGQGATPSATVNRLVRESAAKSS